MNNVTVLALLALLVPACALASSEDSFLTAKRTVYIDQVWTGCRTMLPIVTRDGVQYVAYYDSDRQMTVASRRIDSDT